MNMNLVLGTTGLVNISVKIGVGGNLAAISSHAIKSHFGWRHVSTYIEISSAQYALVAKV